MTLTKNQKILLGIAHFLPIFGIIGYVFFLFSFIFGMSETIAQHPDAPPAEFMQGFATAAIFLILAIFISIGVKVIDIIHLVKNNKGDTGNKIVLWVLLFLFAGVLAEIIYFFLEIVPKKKQDIQQTNGI